MSSRVVRQALLSHSKSERDQASGGSTASYFTAHPQVAEDLNRMNRQSTELLRWMEETKRASSSHTTAGTNSDMFASQQVLAEVDSFPRSVKHTIAPMLMGDKRLAAHRESFEEIAELENEIQNRSSLPVRSKPISVKNRKLVNSRNAPPIKREVKGRSKQTAGNKKKENTQQQKARSLDFSDTPVVSTSEFLRSELEQVSQLGPLLEAKVADIRMKTESDMDELNSKLNFMIKHYGSMADVARQVGVNSLMCPDQTITNTTGARINFDFEILHAELSEIEERKRRVDQRLRSSLQANPSEAASRKSHVHVHQVDMDSRIRKVSSDIEELVRSGMGDSILSAQVNQAKTKSNQNKFDNRGAGNRRYRSANEKVVRAERQQKLAKDLGELLRIPGQRWPVNRTREDVHRPHANVTRSNPQSAVNVPIERRRLMRMDKTRPRRQRGVQAGSQMSVKPAQQPRKPVVVEPEKQRSVNVSKKSVENKYAQAVVSMEEANTQTTEYELPEPTSQVKQEAETIPKKKSTQAETPMSHYNFTSSVLDYILRKHGNSTRFAIRYSVRAAVVMLTQIRPAMEEKQVSFTAVGRLLGCVVRTTFLHAYWLMCSFAVHHAIGEFVKREPQMLPFGGQLEQAVFTQVSKLSNALHFAPTSLCALVASLAFKFVTHKSLCLEAQHALAQELKKGMQEESTGMKREATSFTQAAIQAAAGTYKVLQSADLVTVCVHCIRSAMGAMNGYGRNGHLVDWISVGASVIVGLESSQVSEHPKAGLHSNVCMGISKVAKDSGMEFGTVDTVSLHACLSSIQDAVSVVADMVDMVNSLPLVSDDGAVTGNAHGEANLPELCKLDNCGFPPEKLQSLASAANGVLSRSAILLGQWHAKDPADTPSVMLVVECAAEALAVSKLPLTFENLESRCIELAESLEFHVEQKRETVQTTSAPRPQPSHVKIRPEQNRNAVLSSASLAQFLSERPVEVPPDDQSHELDRVQKKAIEEWFRSRGEPVDPEKVQSLIDFLGNNELAATTESSEIIRNAHHNAKVERWEDPSPEAMVEDLTSDGLLTLVLRMFSQNQLVDPPTEPTEVLYAHEDGKRRSSQSENAAAASHQRGEPPDMSLNEPVVDQSQNELVTKADKEVQADTMLVRTPVKEVENKVTVVQVPAPSDVSKELIELARTQQNWVVEKLAEGEQMKVAVQSEFESRMDARESELAAARRELNQLQAVAMREQLEHMNAILARREEQNESLLNQTTKTHTTFLTEVCSSIKDAIKSLPEVVSQVASAQAGVTQKGVVDPQDTSPSPPPPPPPEPEPHARNTNDSDPHLERHLMMVEDISMQPLNRRWNKESEVKEPTKAHEPPSPVNLHVWENLNTKRTLFDWSDSEREDEESDGHSNSQLSEGEIDVDAGEYSDGQVVL